MILKMAWKNIVRKPMSSLLCITLLLFGVSIISLLLIIQHQLEEKLERDLQNIDLVMGAKGSPLQLVLSSIYHMDAPTGNIKLSEAEKIMNGPMIEEAIPLAYGDSFQGYRILGTTLLYLENYNAEIKEGRVFEHTMEAILGANVAEHSNLGVGDTFLGTHGEAKGGHVHENQSYTVVGLLQKNNTALDNLVITKIESVWQVHNPSHSNGTEHNHDHQHAESKEKEITAVLLKCKTKLAVLNTPRIINEQTNMQAALPGLEINRLFNMLGIGVTTLKLVAAGIMAMAGFSVFFALYGRLKERRFELALMRSLGHRLVNLFGLLLLEGFFLAVLGYFFGVLLSRVGLYFVNLQAASKFNIQFRFEYLADEGWLLLITLFVGVAAALLPAWKATRIDVSKTLSEI